ncbi:3-methyl-2-oxobutanoate hydroxymethyltransferase [Synechococcus sp. PCC 7336]|uniref:3-methyl-2-oxobutanoate hydroxymethyltransferase n=1 Tax=Synechococcus sp. PCC 7336 TaxID=195250 RepID=UPI00034857CD|nr:3-methyl-2-oxobutanoate hydroxymethyltransferase [Synechococcus sp. PCC 7336]
MAKIQIHHFVQSKQARRRLVALTAADYTIAQLLDRSEIDLVLVGDSLAMTALGYANTLPLTLDELIHHCAAVERAVERAFLVADLPFLTYQVSREQALYSAGRLLKEAGAAAVKLEGGYPAMAETVAALVEAGIPVMGHIGLTPQAVHQMGGFRQQGTTREAADRLLHEAKDLQQAGIFALVLEHIPADLARSISEQLVVPTFGIGAGEGCDGQILVTHDLLGLTERMPPFAKSYVNLREIVAEAIAQFCDEVRTGQFPLGDRES